MQTMKQWVATGTLVTMLLFSTSVQATTVEAYIKGEEQIPMPIDLQYTMPIGFTVSRKSIQVNERMDMHDLLTVSGDFTWESSNRDIVRVNDKGVVQGMQVGEATITAQEKTGKTYSCVISVGYKIGIDVASFDKNVDWAKVKAQGMEFAMLRSSYGWNDNFATNPDGQIDTEFSKNLKGVVENNIPFGVYHYAYATTTNQAVAEANYFFYVLSRMPQEYIQAMSLPVAYDLEAKEVANAGLGKEKITDIAIAFGNAIAEKGYTPMIYANKNWFVNNLDIPRLAKQGYPFWYAQYYNDPDIAVKPDIAESGYTPMIWQYASDGYIEGALSTSGKTDMDVMYMPETTIPLLGDVEKNNKVDIYDVYKVLQALAEETSIDIQTADVNENGRVEAYDAYRMLQYTVGSIDIF